MTNETNTTPIYDVAIVGAGAAGLAAAIYSGRYLMKTAIFSEQFGGETALAGVIHNYPGFKEIDGFDLMMKMKEQAAALNAEIIESRVDEITKQGHCFLLKVGDKEYAANQVILGVGAKRRHLGLENEDKFGKGLGIHYCVTCDGPLYKNKVVGVVGGGDASIKGVNLLTQYAKKIYLIVREKDIIAEPINLEEMETHKDKVVTSLETEVTALEGSKKLEKIKLSKEIDGSDEVVLDGLFVEIGAVPDTELAKDLGVKLDERGYIEADNMMRTNVDGVYACGDAVNHFESFKQDVTAAALGAVAATSAYSDHKKHGDLCQYHAKHSGM